MKIKKIFVTILVAALLIAAVGPITAGALDPVVVNLGTIEEAVPGESVVIPVSFGENAGVGAFQFIVTFDPAVLTYVSTSAVGNFLTYLDSSSGKAIFAVNENAASTGTLNMAGAVAAEDLPSGLTGTDAFLELGFTVNSALTESTSTSVAVEVKRLTNAEAGLLESSVAGGTVAVAVRPLTEINLSSSSLYLIPGSHYYFTATPYPVNTTDDFTVVWASDNEEVATVNAETGEVEGIRAGTANITATCGSVNASCAVTVFDVTFETPTLELEISESSTLTYEIDPAGEFTVMWDSDNNEVATVDENGLVTGVALGEAVITGTIEGFDVISCTVTVVNNIVRGDLNGDGLVTVIDALSALRIAAGLVPETAEAIAIADINGDGNITVIDALSILRKAAGLIDVL